MASLLAVALLLAATCHRDERGFVLTGPIEADDVRVGSLTGGRVAAVLAREGDRVAAGDSLVLFDCSRLLASHSEARAAVARAAARLLEARAGYTREEIAEARARQRALVTRPNRRSVSSAERASSQRKA